MADKLVLIRDTKDSIYGPYREAFITDRETIFEITAFDAIDNVTPILNFPNRNKIEILQLTENQVVAKVKDEVYGRGDYGWHGDVVKNKWYLFEHNVFGSYITKDMLVFEQHELELYPNMDKLQFKHVQVVECPKPINTFKQKMQKMRDTTLDIQQKMVFEGINVEATTMRYDQGNAEYTIEYPPCPPPIKPKLVDNGLINRYKTTTFKKGTIKKGGYSSFAQKHSI